MAGESTGLVYGQSPFEDHHGGSLWLKDAQGWFMVRNLAGIEWSAQFCLSGDVKILTADLRWIPIKDATVGQSLLGFDEESKPGLWRRWRPSEVLATRMIERPCYDLIFDDGTKIRASADHRWLVSRGGDVLQHHGSSAWVATEKLRVAYWWAGEEDAQLRELYAADVPLAEIARRLGRSVNGVAGRASRLGLKKPNRHRRNGYTIPAAYRQEHAISHGDMGASRILRLTDVWEEDCSRGAGYLAAAFDGEGWLTQTEDEGRGRGFGTSVRLGFAQRSNAMLEEVEKFLKERGFEYRLRCGSDNCNRILLSTRAEIMRFLGSIRPQRLLADFQPTILGTMQRIGSATLVQKDFAGLQPVVALTTSTGTFVAEGLASHNCADPEKVDLLRQNAKRLYDLLAPAVKQQVDPGGLLDAPITDAAGVARWTDSIFNAGVPLHPSFHTGVLPSGGAQDPAPPASSQPAGVHHYPTPVADIQLFKYDDFQLWVTDEQGNPAAVAPVARRGSGNAHVHVLYATPGSDLARQKRAAERANTPLILGPDHPLSKQAFRKQQHVADPGAAKQ